jgi:tetratricopeptide (TPR) repeat protein
LKEIQYFSCKMKRRSKNTKVSYKYAVIFVCVLLAAVTLAAYWPGFYNDFVNYDDPVYVTENIHVNTGLTRENIVWAFTCGYAENWHPLTWLSHMLDCQLFGQNPRWHHFTSLLLHIANTLLLFIVLKKTTPPLTGAGLCSFFVAAVFALHPLHVQSVAWVAERKDVLSTVFWLLAMYTYADYAQRGGAGRYIVTLLLFALGLMAKPMLVTLPLIMLLMDYWPLARLELKENSSEGYDIKNNGTKVRTISYLLLEKVPFFVLAMISSLITFIVQQKGGAVASVDKLSLASRLCNTPVAYVVYIAKTFLPTGLIAYYPHPRTLPSWQVAGAVLLLVAVSAVILLVNRPYLIFGWLWYIVTLLPVIGLVQVGSQARADRYMYIPMIGLLIMLAWATRDLTARWRFRKIILVPLVCFCLLALMVCVRLNVGYWHDSFTLFSHALEIEPDNHIAHLNLGNTLLTQENTKEAIEHYQEAIRLDGNFTMAHFNLGIAFFQNNQFDKAVEQYNTVLRLNKNYSRVHFYLANALVKTGKPDEAIEHYNIALQNKPDDIEVLNNLALALSDKSRIDDSVRLYKRALELNNDSANIHYNLGNALKKQGRFEEAVQHYEKAIELEPDNIIAYGNLGVVLAEQGNIDEAIRQFHIVLNARPDDVEMLCNLGILLERQGKLEQAVDQYRKAVQISPDDPKARDLLRIALTKQQNH